jgi:tetratricopeptide (TPR) repeat protein
MTADLRPLSDLARAAAEIVRHQVSVAGSKISAGERSAAADAIADAIRAASASLDGDDQAITAALMAGNTTLAETRYTAQIEAGVGTSGTLNLKAADAARGRAALARLSNVRQAAEFYTLATEHNSNDLPTWRNAGLMWRAADDLSRARQAYDGGFSAAERLRDERWRSAFATLLGDIGMADGTLADATMYYQAALAVDRLRAAERPGDEDRTRDLGVSFSKCGDAQTAHGNRPAALDAYQSAYVQFDALTKSAPNASERQRDASVALAKLAEALVAQDMTAEGLDASHAALRIADRLAKSQPDNAVWQRHLAVVLHRIGTVEVAQGNLASALEAFKASIAIRERLAQTDPRDAVWQRSLSVAQDQAMLAFDKTGP